VELEGRNCREGASCSEEEATGKDGWSGGAEREAGAGEGESGDGEGCMSVDEDMQDARRRAGSRPRRPTAYTTELPAVA
jgi:hypothetical protein